MPLSAGKAGPGVGLYLLDDHLHHAGVVDLQLVGDLAVGAVEHFLGERELAGERLLHDPLGQQVDDALAVVLLLQKRAQRAVIDWPLGRPPGLPDWPFFQRCSGGGTWPLTGEAPGGKGRLQTASCSGVPAASSWGPEGCITPRGRRTDPLTPMSIDAGLYRLTPPPVHAEAQGAEDRTL